MSELFLIRHGQASFGSDNYDQLSSLGERQATVLGDYLQHCGIQFDAAFSGELQRQRRTGEIACSAQSGVASMQIDRRFNELNNEEQLRALLPRVLDRHPELKALKDTFTTNSKHYQKVLKQVYNTWVREDCSGDGIQTWQDYAGGVRDALAELMAQYDGGKRVAVFTSGGTIANAVTQVLELPGTASYQFYEPVINCSVTRFVYSRGRSSLSYYNDYSFLALLGAQRDESLVTFR